MLLTSELERTFTFVESGREIKLADPDPQLSPEAVMNFYSAAYPILTTSRIEGPQIRDDEIQFVFRTVMGTKG